MTNDEVLKTTQKYLESQEELDRRAKEFSVYRRQERISHPRAAELLDKILENRVVLLGAIREGSADKKLLAGVKKLFDAQGDLRNGRTVEGLVSQEAFEIARGELMNLARLTC